MKKIFVSVASYRDTDLQNTIDSLFANAEFPERVFVGVFLQIADSADADDSACLVKLRPNLRVEIVNAKDARGPGWARNRIQSMWQGEDFFFQVDSHMRFAKNWDSKLIDMWAKCPGRSVLSTYPLPFTLPNNLSADKYVTIKPKAFDVDGVLLQNSGMVPLSPTQEIVENYFISAGMLFGPSIMIHDVPADPYIFFTGEEITTALRLWTHGYDIYVPNKVIAYHNYQTNTGRPRIWDDSAITAQYKKESRDRVRWLCGDTSVPIPNNHIDKYSMGTERTLQEYGRASGVDFKNKLYLGTRLTAQKS